jgi:hypothetical protein
MKRSHQIRKVVLAFCLVLFGVRALNAQENTDALGGMGYGPGGSVSYSIGQIDYETATGTGGTITEGLQQPYEILIISGIEDNNINLNLEVYPNPTTDLIVLSVDNVNTLNMYYTIYNIEGKLIEKQELGGSKTTITMKELSNGIYFIKVLQKNTELKVFKVIKNN